MKNFISLRVLDLFGWLYTKLQVDYKIMRKILQIKLTNDERRVPTLLSSNNNDTGNMFTKSLFVYTFIGLLIGIMILLPLPLFFKLNIVFGMILFMIMTTMISDYSSVLLDVNEKNMLLTKPISRRTYNAAKTTHIYVYLFKIILAISLPTVLIGSFKYGIYFPLLYLVQTIFIAALVIFATSIVYYIILHFFDGERLKDIINYFQIFLAAITFIAYQFIGKAFELASMTMGFKPSWWSFFLPSTWFAAPYVMVLEGTRDIHYLISSLLGVVVPIVLLLLYYYKVAYYFENKLQKLNNSETRKKELAEKKEDNQLRIGKFICKHPIERIFYRFTLNMIAKERTLKLKLYPSLAMAALFPFVFIIRDINLRDGMHVALEVIRGSRNYLNLYFTAVICASSAIMLRTTEKPKSAWIYRVLPIENNGVIQKGVIKAYIIRLLLPVYIPASTIFLLLHGGGILLDLLFILLAAIILIIIVVLMEKKEYPFSLDFEVLKHSNISVLFITGIPGLALFFIHWLSKRNEINAGLLIMGAIVLIPILWKQAFKDKNKLV